jgi:hypothetical protein
MSFATVMMGQQPIDTTTEGRSDEQVQQQMIDIIKDQVLFPLAMNNAYTEALQFLNMNEKGELQV